MTATEESLFRGAARTALTTGVPVSIRYGADAMHDLEIVLDEQLPADRVVVGGLDRKDAVAAGAPLEVAAPRRLRRRWTTSACDDDAHVTDRERAALVVELVEAGHADRILLSSNAIGVAKGHARSRPAVRPRPVHVRPPRSRRWGSATTTPGASSWTTRATC